MMSYRIVPGNHYVLRDDWREQLVYLYESGYISEDLKWKTHKNFTLRESEGRTITTFSHVETPSVIIQNTYRPASQKEILKAEIKE